MALRNAFEELATETTLRKLVSAVTFARDINQRLRVVVDGTAVTVGTQYFGSSNVVPVYYSTGAPMSMDARETQRLASIQAGQISRQRWTYS